MLQMFVSQPMIGPHSSWRQPSVTNPTAPVLVEMKSPHGAWWLSQWLWKQILGIVVGVYMCTDR